MPTSITGSGLINGLELPTDSLKGGLVLVNQESFTSVSSVSFDNCFTSEYDHYRVIGNLSGASTNIEVRARTRLSGTDDSGSNYYTSLYYIGTTGAAAGSTVGTVDTSWRFLFATDSTDATNNVVMDFHTPLSGKRKQAEGLSSTRNPSAVGYGYVLFYNKINTTNYDGLTLIGVTGTFSGTISIYGYRNGI